MTARTLMGMESEFGATLLGTGSGHVERAQLKALSDHVRRGTPAIPDGTEHGLYLANGARFYFDCSHPEYATPECETPYDVVASMRAGESLLDEAAQAAVGGGAELALFRCNVDYAQPGIAWGCHESYLHALDPACLPRQLLAHLATRIVYTGAGGFAPHAPGVEFTLSPRAWLFTAQVSHDSTAARGIFHTRDEPLACAPWRRMHVTCGESLCSDVAAVLKLGSTALILATMGEGWTVDESLVLHAPVQALKAVAADPTCQVPLPLRGGQRATPLEIQRQYLAFVEQGRAAGRLPPWADAVCALWREALDHLARNDGWAQRNLDWAIKLDLYRDWVGGAEGREGWEALVRMNATWRHVHQRLEQALVPLGKVMPGGIDKVIGDGTPIPEEVARLTGWMAARRCDWDQVRAFLHLREELLEIDVRFGRLGVKGIYHDLARNGVVAGMVVDPADVERRRTHAPPGGRASARGALIREVCDAGKGAWYQAEWTRITEHRGRRHADLRDPFTTSAAWESPEPEDPGPGFIERYQGFVSDLFG